MILFAERVCCSRDFPLPALAGYFDYRFYLLDRDIKVTGGRERNLRDLQSWMFTAGANSTMIGNYLTTSGRDCRADLQLIEDLDLHPLGHG